MLADGMPLAAAMGRSGPPRRLAAETITERLECIPRSDKVIQTVREEFSCRACEAITQPPAPFRPIARGRAGRTC